jgi:hypothetical protein
MNYYKRNCDRSNSIAQGVIAGLPGMAAIATASAVNETSSDQPVPAPHVSPSRLTNMRKIQEVVCVEEPLKIILYFQDGGWQTAGRHTQMAFGYEGGGPRNFSLFLAASGFAFTDATKFCAPRTYRSDGTTMDGTIVGDEIHWENGTTTRIPAFPEFY